MEEGVGRCRCIGVRSLLTGGQVALLNKKCMGTNK